MSDYSAFTIPLAKAQEWTENWQKKHTDLPKAFILPIEDLLGCLTEMGVITTNSAGNVTIKYDEDEKVRAYLGIAKDGEEKLVMVGTKKEDGTYADIINSEEDGGSSGIFDSSEPCPPQCDPKSPLNP